MSNILEEILATKRGEVAAAKVRIPISALLERIERLPPTRDFVGAIRARHAANLPAVIAEIKRKSPSAGLFRDAGDFVPARFAAQYAANGAACLSVLTDDNYFGGTAEDLAAARGACELPILRKDFIVDEYQVYEARAMGADAVLFIMDALTVAEFVRIEALAHSLGLAVLAESHTEAQLKQALLLKTPLMGINNRDLTRFETSLDTTLTLAPQVPSGRIVVTESGIESRQAIELMRKNGILTFLVGGALMRQPDPGAALAALFGAG
jgi:indole-3-glycerol phosphate synthase